MRIKGTEAQSRKTILPYLFVPLFFCDFAPLFLCACVTLHLCASHSGSKNELKQKSLQKGTEFPWRLRFQTPGVALFHGHLENVRVLTKVDLDI